MLIFKVIFKSYYLMLTYEGVLSNADSRVINYNFDCTLSYALAIIS